MGVIMRRFTEQVKQGTGLLPATFIPTNNARNELMLKEASGFDAHLKVLEKEIASIKAATEGMFRTTRSVLSAPLPRVFSKPPAGGGSGAASNGGAATNSTSSSGQQQPQASPVDAGVIGGAFDGDALTAAGSDAAARLTDNVLAPMERWRAGFVTVTRQMARLEAMRLELDSRRHTTQALASDLERRRPGLERGGASGAAASPRNESRLEELQKRLRHKEGKETAALNRYLAEEELVAQHLAQLIGDAEWLKSFVADVMRTQSDAFSSALRSLGPTKPTPDVRTPRYEAVVAGGADE